MGKVASSTSTLIDDDEEGPSHRGSPQSLGNLALPDAKDARVEWSEMDFPPLSDVRGERRTEHGVWGEKKPSELGAEGYVTSIEHLRT